jgi:hypothetical protein
MDGAVLPFPHYSFMTCKGIILRAENKIKKK